MRVLASYIACRPCGVTYSFYRLFKCQLGKCYGCCAVYFFPAISDFGLLFRMCLATLIFHRDWIKTFLSFNHVVEAASVCCNYVEDVERIKREDWLVLHIRGRILNLLFLVSHLTAHFCST
jgi:hypothetical protein